MHILERIIAVVAPHDCLVCGQEGGLLCKSCMVVFPAPLPERCYRCNRLSRHFRTCAGCRSKSSLRSVYVRADYGDVASGLVSALKFDHARAAAEVLAQLMQEVMPADHAVVVVPVPTANSRRRQRGFDQADLLAAAISRRNNLLPLHALQRNGGARQLGAGRAQRHKQLENAFWLGRRGAVRGKTILLIDDVVTTGSTLETAAKVLREAGAKHVDALVFAKA